MDAGAQLAFTILRSPGFQAIVVLPIFMVDLLS